MKKLVVVVVVLVVALLVAPWGVGKLAEQRVNYGIDQLVQQAPYLKVVESKWTRGWFKSEHVVTFEAFGELMELLNPETLKDAMKKDAADAAGAVEPEGAGEPAVIASPDAVPPAEAPVKLKDLMRFTVRNEVLHGPVLGLSGFGIARVDTHLVLSEETEKEITEVFGPKPPIEASTVFGLLGGGTTTFKSEGRTIKPKGKAEVSWETFKIALGYSRDADSYSIDGKWPRIDAKSLENKTQFVMKDMTLDGKGKRLRGDLYDGNLTFRIASMSVLGNPSDEVEITDLHYIGEVASKDDFTAIVTKVGTGVIKSKQLSAVGVELKEFHYDFSVNHLHSETLEKLVAGVKAMYATPVTPALELDKVIFAPFKEQGSELLKYNPEISIDRIGIATADGDGYLKGVITLKGATAEDFAEGSKSGINKIHADLTIDVSEKMIQKFPNGSMAAGGVVDAGYAVRKGDRLICKIVFADGALTINGKPQAIPGLGGPPAEEMTPQE